jgi:hypothetical protein
MIVDCYIRTWPTELVLVGVVAASLLSLLSLNAAACNSLKPSSRVDLGRTKQLAAVLSRLIAKNGFTFLRT